MVVAPGRSGSRADHLNARNGLHVHLVEDTVIGGSSGGGFTGGRGNTMTLAEFMGMLRQRWVSVVAFVVLGAAVALGISLLMPPVYSAQATDFVSIGGEAGQSDSLYQNSEFALNRVGSYTQMVHSPAVLHPVVQDLELPMTIRQLDNSVTVTNPTGTVLLNVVATSGSASHARAIANAVARELSQQIEALETPRSGEASPVKVTMAVPAALPLSPTSPRMKLNMALGLLIGLVLGAAYATFRHQVDTTVKSSEELGALAEASVLGAIRRHPGLAERPLIALSAGGPEVEDIRSIRTSLQFTAVDKQRSQLVISSATAGEGKTVTACNLAMAMSQIDRSVCLIDGDLRRPRVASVLGIDGSVGLSDVVVGHADLDDALVPWNRGMLTVLPAGTSPPDPTSLLSTHAASELFKRLAERFDILIIDGPPLLAVSDAAILSTLSDGVVLVGRYGRVRRDQVRRAVSSLKSAGGDLLGVVITDVAGKRLDAGYGTVQYAATDESDREPWRQLA